MEEFSHQIKQLHVIAHSMDNVHVDNLVNESEQIGQHLKSSQDFLLKEIQHLKHELEINYTNEFRTSDKKTLKTLKTKLQELNQTLTNMKIIEMNTWHLVQTLRTTTSRLRQMFETVIGSTISQELIYEDSQKLFNRTQLENDEQLANLTLIEKEHSELLLKVKEIHLSLEQFRTTILHATQNINEMKMRIQTQQQINIHTHEQLNKRIHHLLSNTNDIQTLLIDYKSTMNEISHLLKLIFHVQTQIELYHKSMIDYQIKFEKYKQDLTLLTINRTNYETQLSNLQKRIEEQNHHLQRLEFQQKQIHNNRQQLHKQIHIREDERNQILNNQQQLLETIKRTTIKNHLLQKKIIHCKHDQKDTQYSYRQLINDHKKQQQYTNNLQKTIQINDQQFNLTNLEINRVTEQVEQKNHLINLKGHHIDLYAKELLNLEHCLSTTQDELTSQHRKVTESKCKVLSFTQKIHKLSIDERPLMKEISRNQRQLIHNEVNHLALDKNLKQNEAKIIHYKTMISKLTFDTKQIDDILLQENQSLHQYLFEHEKTKMNIKTFYHNLQQSEYSYEDLKEIFTSINNENKQLKRQYEKFTFLIQLLGEKHAIFNNQSPILNNKIKYFTQQYHNKSI
ncbi:hypothetical protein I4U23_002009 [Adineta vaga]|nr:hypothetical protein I4U23_002009 [Adineta vaga]